MAVSGDKGGHMGPFFHLLQVPSIGLTKTLPLAFVYDKC